MVSDKYKLTGSTLGASAERCSWSAPADIESNICACMVPNINKLCFHTAIKMHHCNKIIVINNEINHNNNFFEEAIIR